MLLALRIGQARGTLSDEQFGEIVKYLYHVPAQMERFLDDDAQLQDLARTFQHHSDFLFLGRGVNYPIALEGALKLKEISYIHAEGYPAGEMKHGPIALIDRSLPVVALAFGDKVYDKMMANIEEVRAREGRIIAITDQENGVLPKVANHVITIPKTSDLLTPILAVVPLQLIAYHIALRRGCDVDQPRNLAKSVTVE